MVDEGRPYGVATPSHNVNDTPREQLGQQPGQLERRQRSLLGGLEHYGVAGGQGRRELPRGHHQWVVPRGDLRHHADGVAADHAGVAGEVLVGGAAAEHPGRAGEEPEAVDDGRQLVGQHADAGLAAVERLELGVGRSLLLETVGEPEQQ